MTKPIATVKIPQVVNKAESAIKRAAHFISVSAADIVSNIKDKLKSAFSEPNNKVPERKPTKNQPVKPKSRAVQSDKPKKPVQEQRQEKEKVPMFSISELKSDKYAPTSSKSLFRIFTIFPQNDII